MKSERPWSWAADVAATLSYFKVQRLYVRAICEGFVKMVDGASGALIVVVGVVNAEV